MSYDAASMMGVTRDLVNHGSLQASAGFSDYLHLSTPYSPYGVGTSLLLVPLYVLSKVTGNEPTVLSLLNPLLTATTVVVAYAIGRRLRWSESLAVLGAGVFALCTMALQGTTELFSEPGVALCIALIVYGMLRWRNGLGSGAVLVGIAAAVAIQLRSDSLFTVCIGMVAIPLFVPMDELLRRGRLIALALPLLVSLVALGAYNYLRWHSIFKSSYNGVGFHTPLLHGLNGLLLSPGKSFFLFNPVAVLGLVGLFLLCRSDRAVGVLFLLLIVPRVVFFARWDLWQGGVDWGPRFLMPIVLLFVLAAVEVVHRTIAHSFSGALARVAFAVLSVLGLGVSYLSVRVPYEQWSVTLANPALATRYADGHPFYPRTDPRAAPTVYDDTFRASQIRGDLNLVLHGGALMGPAAFREGDDAVGWLLLVLGGVGFLGAGGVARSTDRARRAKLEMGNNERTSGVGVA